MKQLVTEGRVADDVVYLAVARLKTRARLGPAPAALAVVRLDRAATVAYDQLLAAGARDGAAAYLRARADRPVGPQTQLIVVTVVGRPTDEARDLTGA